jgi:glycosyltransferase involved in cell wall biosynthesis
VFHSLRKQINVEECEILLMSEGKSVVQLNSKLDINKLQIFEHITPKGNGIFRNFSLAVPHAKGSYLLLLDDDIVLQNIDLIFKLEKFLDSNEKVWAVGPFIDENRGNSQTALAKLENHFKKAFRIWDPDDYTNTIYSCYGKGSANFRDTLPRKSYIGCQWLTNQALLIRKNVFAQYHDDDLEHFNKFHSIERIWAVDFYLTHRLYLKNHSALAFLPEVKVLHLGTHSTSFNKNERILRETICGIYYYKRFLGNKGFVKAYVIPNIGRMLYIVLSNWRHPLNLLRAFFMYLISFAQLAMKANAIRRINVYG